MPNIRRDAVTNLIIIGIIAAIFAAPAVAQTSNPICNDDNLSNLQSVINGIIQLAFFGGFAGTVVTYFGTTAVESAPVTEKRRETLKALRKRSFGASTKLLIAGPVLYFILNGVVDMSCITLIPWA
jgi:hypothetical protein